METRPEHHFSASVDQGILVITLSGEVKPAQAGRLHDEVVSAIESPDVSAVMVDVRALKGRLGYAEAYLRIADHLPGTASPRVAIVDLPENAAYQRFLETAAVNAGRSLKCFTDPDAAKAWLKGKPLDAGLAQ
jgi:hypothetical protein